VKRIRKKLPSKATPKSSAKTSLLTPEEKEVRRRAMLARPRPRPVPIFHPSPAAVRRSEYISLLLPLLSQMRHSRNSESLSCVQALQSALAGMELLNDVERVLAERELKLDTIEETLQRIVRVLAPK
jgi:hypothetical protein